VGRGGGWGGEGGWGGGWWGWVGLGGLFVWVVVRLHHRDKLDECSSWRGAATVLRDGACRRRTARARTAHQGDARPDDEQARRVTLLGQNARPYHPATPSLASSRSLLVEDAQTLLRRDRLRMCANSEILGSPVWKGTHRERLRDAGSGCGRHRGRTRLKRLTPSSESTPGVFQTLNSVAVIP